MKGFLKELAEAIGAFVVGGFTALFILAVFVSPKGLFEETVLIEKYVFILVALGVVVVWIFYGLLVAIKNRLDELSSQSNKTTDLKEK